jgi:hypothetical protein
MKAFGILFSDLIASKQFHSGSRLAPDMLRLPAFGVIMHDTSIHSLFLGLASVRPLEKGSGWVIKECVN